MTRAAAGTVAPPLTGGISASSSPASTAASSPTYSRLRATRTGIAARISVSPGSRPAAASASATVAALGQLQGQPVAPRALAQDREQAKLDLHRDPS